MAETPYSRSGPGSLVISASEHRSKVLSWQIERFSSALQRRYLRRRSIDPDNGVSTNQSGHPCPTPRTGSTSSVRPQERGDRTLTLSLPKGRGGAAIAANSSTLLRRSLETPEWLPAGREKTLQRKVFSTAARIPVVRLPARLTRISCPLAVSSYALQRRAWACRRGRHRGARAEIRVSRAAPAHSMGLAPTTGMRGRVYLCLRVREGEAHNTADYRK